jgi:hypothetical protein
MSSLTLEMHFVKQLRMKYFFILIALFLISFSGFCQTQSDTITIVKKGRFAKDEEFLNSNQLLVLLRGNREAFELMKKARSNSALASVFSFTGGVLIGLPLELAIGGGDINWGMVAVGGGFIVLSIPLIYSYRNNSTRAVESFNRGLLEAHHRKIEIHFQTNANGVGLGLRF